MNDWRILVVDDEAGILHSVKRILSPLYEVFTTESARDAIDLARQINPDLAIVDIRMPEMDGFELTNLLHSAIREIDVILMTGSMHETDESLVRAIRHKAFYYISKPFEREVLLTLVDRCLELKRLQMAERSHAIEMQRQLQSAGAFQRTMLPANCADIEGFSISAEYQPCESVAGDFYTYAASGEGAITVLVADVVGHGASAAMLTSIVKSAFHKARNDNFDPLTVTELIGGDMAAFNSDQFLTLICARLCCREGTLKYVNAGHPAGLLIDTKGAVTELSSTGPIISPVTMDLGWESVTEPWSRGHSLLMYTDGAVEPSRLPVVNDDSPKRPKETRVEDSEGRRASSTRSLAVDSLEQSSSQLEEFGAVRLRDAAVDAIRNDRNALHAIIEDLTAFTESAPLLDDITLVLVRGK